MEWEKGSGEHPPVITSQEQGLESVPFMSLFSGARKSEVLIKKQKTKVGAVLKGLPVTVLLSPHALGKKLAKSTRPTTSCHLSRITYVNNPFFKSKSGRKFKWIHTST